MRFRAVEKVLVVVAALAGPSLPSIAHAYQEQRTFDQEESRDGEDRVTVEAATVHVIACSDPGEHGGEVYIYEYLNRSGFRAVRPPNWSTPIGGVEYATLAEAAKAACG